MPSFVPSHAPTQNASSQLNKSKANSAIDVKRNLEGDFTFESTLLHCEGDERLIKEHIFFECYFNGDLKCSRNETVEITGCNQHSCVDVEKCVYNSTTDTSTMHIKTDIYQCDYSTNYGGDDGEMPGWLIAIIVIFMLLAAAGFFCGGTYVYSHTTRSWTGTVTHWYEKK